MQSNFKVFSSLEVECLEDVRKLCFSSINLGTKV